MKIRRKVEIVIETRQTTTVRRNCERGTRRWCPVCSAEVEWVTPEEATEDAGVTGRTVYGLDAAGRVHFAETPEGLLLVCLDSPARRLLNTESGSDNNGQECSS